MNAQRLGNALRFWETSTRSAKNLCDAVVAHFFGVPARLLPRAFHPKARSHCSIAVLGEDLCDGANERAELECALGVNLDQATKPQRTKGRLLFETGEKFWFEPATVEMPGMALAAKEAFGSYRRAANAMNFDVCAWQAHKPLSRRT